MCKSRRGRKYARRAAAREADVLFVWGGGGTVRRCIDAVAGAGLDARMISDADRGMKGYELDGGARPASKKLRIKVHPGSVTVCVPSGRRE